MCADCGMVALYVSVTGRRISLLCQRRWLAGWLAGLPVITLCCSWLLCTIRAAMYMSLFQDLRAALVRSLHSARSLLVLVLLTGTLDADRL